MKYSAPVACSVFALCGGALAWRGNTIMHDAVPPTYQSSIQQDVRAYESALDFVNSAEGIDKNPRFVDLRENARTFIASQESRSDLRAAVTEYQINKPAYDSEMSAGAKLLAMGSVFAGGSIIGLTFTFPTPSRRRLNS